METTRLYARMVASVNPAWIERAGAHLVKRTYSEPHWVASRGFVAATSGRRSTGCALRRDAVSTTGRLRRGRRGDIFIREALLMPRAGPVGPSSAGEFLEANRRLRLEIERLEAKIRRRDILAS